MLNLGILTDLYKHMEWADADVWTAVLRSKDGPTDQKLRDYLYHLHLVQYAFLKAWRGETAVPTSPTFDDAASLMAWARAYHGQGLSHLESLGEQGISKPMMQPWTDMIEQQIGKRPAETTLGETALQVALHSQYHRGQANARLRAVEGAPPMVDYIVWLWLGKPPPSWP